MGSAYFKIKIKTEDFKNNFNTVVKQCSGKKVLLYGDNKTFTILNNKFNLIKKLNIVAIINEQFVAGQQGKICGIKTISKDDTAREIFDVIVIIDENAQKIIPILEIELGIKQDKIYCLFIETLKEERQNVNFLYKNKFDKTFPKLVKKMKNKKVILYGAGIFLEVINKYFDLSQLNIIGIADKKYSLINNEEKFLGYKTFNPTEIIGLNPDYVLMSTKFYVNLFEFLHFDLLQNSKIKIKPLMKKGFFILLKEIIES